MKDILLLNNMYATQVFNLSINCLLIKIWVVPHLNIIIDNEIEKPVKYNQSLFFIKKNINFVIR